jgi:hypothetical protein
VTTAPTCTEKGSVTYTCSACGSSYTEAIDATGHHYIDGFCTSCGGADPDNETEADTVPNGSITLKTMTLSLEDEIVYNLYFEVSAHADRLAEQLRAKFVELGYDFFMPAQSNQLFPILPAKVRAYLAEKYTFIEMDKLNDGYVVCRFCTSWATRQENVDALCADLEKISG